MTFHVVCHDCTFEGIVDDEETAAEAKRGHDEQHPSHDVEYADVGPSEGKSYGGISIYREAQSYAGVNAEEYR